ncbi:MAG: 50S ribosomal protein L13 [bacterium]
MYKTHHQKKEDIKRSWRLFDASGKSIGKLASEIATVLMGKEKSDFSYHLDQGDHVIVVNAAQINIKPRKLAAKKYFNYSGYPGGMKASKQSDLIKDNPKIIIEKAVYNMVASNRLRKARMKRLHVYADDKHPYAKQLESK